MQFQSIVNLRPIYVNPVQIGRLFGSIHPQFKANPGQFNLNPLSIHIHFDANPLSIQCQFAADSGQPTSNAAQIQPMHYQYAKSLPIHHQSNANPRPIYQSDFPMPIRDQPANPGQIFQFIPFLPIHCRSEDKSIVNPVPIKVNPIECQSVGNLGQSIPNSPIHQSNPIPNRDRSRSIQCQSTPDPVPIWRPSQSIHRQSSSISVPILGQSNTNIVLILENPQIQCQSNNDPPIHYQPTIKF